MYYDEFVEYLKQNVSHALDQFLEKATEFQNNKNKERAKKSRWNEARVQREITGMYTQLLSNAYEKIKAEKGVPKYNGHQIWIDFMEEKNFLEMFADGISETEFE